MEKDKCNICSTGYITAIAAEGRATLHRGRRVTIPDTFLMRTCDGCGEGFMTHTEAVELTKVLDSLFLPRE